MKWRQTEDFVTNELWNQLTKDTKGHQQPDIGKKDFLGICQQKFSFRNWKLILILLEIGFVFAKMSQIRLEFKLNVTITQPCVHLKSLQMYSGVCVCVPAPHLRLFAFVWECVCGCVFWLAGISLGLRKD